MVEFEVVVGAGTFRNTGPGVVHFPHHWTAGGVSVEAPFTGGHLGVLAPAGCILNDVYREAATLGIRIDGVRVSATGGLTEGTWESTGIHYTIDIDSPAEPRTVDHLVTLVDSVAEIPKVLRATSSVGRTG